MSKEAFIAETASIISLSLPLSIDKQNLESIRRKFELVKELIVAYSSAEEKFSNLSNETKALRSRAYVALDMKCEAMMQMAVESLQLSSAVCDGTKFIEDYGFPEFSDK